MSALFAFLHHTAAFGLVAALVVEFVLIRDELTLKSARQMQVADAIFGASAGLVLAVGLARVFYFEKGAAYYFHSIPFIAKFSLFILIGLISIYPTMKFMSWKKSTQQGIVPSVSPGSLRVLRTIIHLELVGVVFIILFAVLMARGIGYFG